MAARGERSLNDPEHEHLSACLRCRAEQVRYRRLMEAMKSLRELPARSDPSLESRILDGIESQRQRLSRRQRLALRVSSRAAAAAGGLAAGAAATAGLMAVATRHRRFARFAS